MSPAGVVMARRPLKPAAAGVLLPSVSATALLWVRADNGAQKDTGGTPCVASGDTCAAWADQTYAPAQGHNVQAQNIPADNATFQTAQVNGLPCVRFNGTSAALAATFTVSAPYDLFFMVKAIAWTSGRWIVASRAGDTWGVYQSPTTPNIVIYNGVGDSAINAGLTVGTWHLLQASFPLSAPNVSLKVDNAAATTGNAFGGTGLTGIYIGAHSGPASFCNMDLAEVLMYNAILSGTDATAVRAYFTGRYGIP